MADECVSEQERILAKHFQQAAQGLDVVESFNQIGDALATAFRNEANTVAHLRKQHAQKSRDRFPIDSRLSSLSRLCERIVGEQGGWPRQPGVQFAVLSSSINEQFEGQFKVVVTRDSREFIAECEFVVGPGGAYQESRTLRWSRETP